MVHLILMNPVIIGKWLHPIGIRLLKPLKNHYVVIVLHLIYHQEWMNVCQVRFLMIVVD